MRTTSRSLFAAALTMLSITLAAGAEQEPAPEAEPEREERLWAETGETRHGRLEAHFEPAVPPPEPGDVDFESLERVEKRRESQLNKTFRQIPPLRYTVPVPARRDPPDPPSFPGAVRGAAGDFVFEVNSEPTMAVMPAFSATVNEPSVVSGPNSVLYTGNWYAATSSDGGQSFSFVDPFTGPFPPDPNGFCCDQVTAIDPLSGSIFWLQQYLPSASSGTQRINVDVGGDGTFDCHYNVSPQILGFPTNNFPDFPDLAVSDTHLYHSSNVFSTLGAGFTGAFVARYPLASIAQCAGGVPFDVYTDPSFFSFKLTRGARSTMYFADHISNASIRIWRWLTASAGPVAFDRAVTAWSDAARVCPGPDGRDWCGFIDRRLAGAFVADGTVGFLWVPAADGTYPRPYTRVARFDELTLVLDNEQTVWSSSIAWAYPSAAVNRNGDVGGTIMAGGAGLHPSCLAWIADDTNGDTFGPLENRVALFGSSGPSTNRSGDYNSTSTHTPNPYLWAGACFAYAAPTITDARFILFGRQGNTQLLFTDGFESGDTSAW